MSASLRILLLLLGLPVCARAQSLERGAPWPDSTVTNVEASQAEWQAAVPRGLSLSARYTPFLTSLSARKRGNGAFALRVAYDVLPWLGTGLAIATGSENVDVERAPATSGSLSLGAGIINVVVHPIESLTLRPFLSAGYGLFTILDGGDGYNGAGFELGAGEEIRVGSDVGLSASLEYQHRRYPHLIIDGRSTDVDAAIQENVLGIGVGATIYFELRP